MQIRKACMEDWEEIRKIYAGARQFMAEHGNARQWGSGNPPEDLLLDNIARGKLYVCMNEGQIAAVFYFAKEEEPTYRVIEDGKWLNDAPYGVVHRIASARIIRGAASFCIDWAFRQTGNIRIDTHRDNIPMHNMLRKNGFRYCGIIYLENGDPRLAFQKASDTMLSAGNPDSLLKPEIPVEAQIPEKFLKMLSYAEEILETDKSSPLAVIVTTANGDMMGFASRFADTDRTADRIADENKFLQSLAERGETEISCGLCKWRNGNLDVPSANIQRGLEELDKTNLEAEFLLQGDGEFHFKSISSMRPLKVV